MAGVVSTTPAIFTCGEPLLRGSPLKLPRPVTPVPPSPGRTKSLGYLTLSYEMTGAHGLMACPTRTLRIPAVTCE